MVSFVAEGGEESLENNGGLELWIGEVQVCHGNSAGYVVELEVHWYTFYSLLIEII